MPSTTNLVPRAAFSLLEVMIALSILALTVGVMFGAVSTSNQMQNTALARERVAERLHQIVADMQARNYLRTYTPVGGNAITGVYDYYTANPSFDIVGLKPPSGANHVGSIAFYSDSTYSALLAAGSAPPTNPAAGTDNNMTQKLYVMFTCQWLDPSTGATTTVTEKYTHAER